MMTSAWRCTTSKQFYLFVYNLDRAMNVRLVVSSTCRKQMKERRQCMFQSAFLRKTDCFSPIVSTNSFFSHEKVFVTIEVLSRKLSFFSSPHTRTDCSASLPWASSLTTIPLFIAQLHNHGHRYELLLRSKCDARLFDC